MAKTVVGLFKSMADAQNIKHQLINEGYSAENIRVVANDQTTAGTSTAMPATAGAGSQETGVMGSIKKFFSSFTDADETDSSYYSEGVTRGGAILAATVPDERASALVATLERYGAMNVDEQSSGVATGNVSRAASTATTTTAAGTTGDVAIPIVQEELLVGKRQVNRGGIRVYSHVVETPVEESIRLREEHVTVQRNTINRPASEADFTAFKEGTIELTETAEEAVVGKQARVIEEVTIGKGVSERTQTVSDTVRHTEVEVEELAGELGTTTNTVKGTTASGK